MSFQPEHIGLYFGQSHIKLTQEQHKKHSDLQIAWQWLLAESGEVVSEIKPKNKRDKVRTITKPTLDRAGQAIEAAFRYRFLDDDSEAEKAIAILQDSLKFYQRETLLETIQATLTAAHCFEMTREQFKEAEQWLNEFASFTDTLLKGAVDAPTLEQLWLIPLQVVRAIILEDEAQFEAGTALYRQAVDELIHPEGYLKLIVQDEKDAVKAYRDMTLACAALVLAAEAATQAGDNLQAYQNRDVSPNTAATYLVYYYFYPEKWQWGEGLTQTDTERIFRDYGAWLEIIAHYQMPRGAEILLDQQRPFFNASIGGLTTLSHLKTQTKKRWRLFG